MRWQAIRLAYRLLAKFSVKELLIILEIPGILIKAFVISYICTQLYQTQSDANLQQAHQICRASPTSSTRSSSLVPLRFGIIPKCFILVLALWKFSSTIFAVFENWQNTTFEYLVISRWIESSIIALGTQHSVSQFCLLGYLLSESIPYRLLLNWKLPRCSNRMGNFISIITPQWVYYLGITGTEKVLIVELQLFIWLSKSAISFVTSVITLLPLLSYRLMLGEGRNKTSFKAVSSLVTIYYSCTQNSDENVHIFETESKQMYFLVRWQTSFMLHV